MSKKKIYIHAGAHRTGTSSFQNCLSHNRAALKEAGFDAAYPGRDGAEGGTLKLRLPEPRHGEKSWPQFQEWAANQMRKHSPDGARALVLSEENLPGRMMHFFSGRFFPAAQQRMRVMRAAMPGQVAHLLYVVRSYDQMFVSSYRQQAEMKKMRAFDEYREAFLGFEGGWVDLVALMRDELAPSRITVIDYAKRGESRDLLARLLPDAPDTWEEPPVTEWNVSANDAGLAALQARYSAGESLKRPERRVVVEAHAGDKTAPKIAAFASKDAAALKDRFARDLDGLVALKGVDLIR